MERKQQICLITVRLAMGLAIQSYFHADEFWQYQEVPYRNVFGKGYLTYEWKDKYGPMRSPAMNIPLELVYYFLKYTGLDYGVVIAQAPRVMGGIFAGFFDIYLIKITRLMFPSLAQDKHSLIYLVSFGLWFLNFCLSRYLVNSFETTMVIISFYYFKKGQQQLMKRLHQQFRTTKMLFYSLMIITFLARPTSVVMFVPLLVQQIVLRLYLKTTIVNFVCLFAEHILLIVVSIASSLGLDYMYFGRFLSSSYNFIYFNIILGGSSHYGEFDMFYYFRLFIPFQYNFWLIYILQQSWDDIKAVQNVLKQKKKTGSWVKDWLLNLLDIYRYNEFMLIILFFVLFVSKTPHKEDRFILPIHGLMILQIVKHIYQNQKLNFRSRFIKIFMINLVYLMITNSIHRVGAVNMMNDLRNIETNKQRIEVLHLGGCHETPYQQFVHNKQLDIRLEMPDCSPNLELEEDEMNSYAILYSDPLRYFREYYVEKEYDYLILSDRVKDAIDKYDIAEVKDYKLVKRYFNFIKPKINYFEFPFFQPEYLYLYAR